MSNKLQQKDVELRDDGIGGLCVDFLRSYNDKSVLAGGMMRVPMKPLDAIGSSYVGSMVLQLTRCGAALASQNVTKVDNGLSDEVLSVKT